MKWLLKNQRWLYLLAGLGIGFVFFMLNGLLFQFCENFLVANIIITTLVIFSIMLIVEHIKEKFGNKLDYLSIFAGCIPVIIAFICIIISILI